MSEQESSAKEGNLRKLATRVGRHLYICIRFPAHERYPQEARRDGVFAGLTSGLTGGKIVISDPRLMVAEMLRMLCLTPASINGLEVHGFQQK